MSIASSQKQTAIVLSEKQSEQFDSSKVISFLIFLNEKGKSYLTKGEFDLFFELLAELHTINRKMTEPKLQALVRKTFLSEKSYKESGK